jgi:hypothetical protein
LVVSFLALRPSVHPWVQHRNERWQTRLLIAVGHLRLRRLWQLWQLRHLRLQRHTWLMFVDGVVCVVSELFA